MKDIKKIQVKLVEINTSELEWQHIKLCERISVLEDIAVEMIQNETQKKNVFNENTIYELWVVGQPQVT